MPDRLLAAIMGNIMYDLLVVGLGIHGLMTLRFAHESGLAALGIDMITPGNATSSSSGETRIFRRTILEDAGYLELAADSDVYWRSLASDGTAIKESGFALVAEPGSLFQRHHGARNILDSAARVATEADIPYRLMSSDEYMALGGPLVVSPGSRVFLEPHAYVLHVDEIFKTLQKGIQSSIKSGKSLMGLNTDSECVTVSTSDGARYLAKKVVLTMGRWMTSHPVTRSRFRDVDVMPQPVAWDSAVTQREIFPATVITSASKPLIFSIPAVSAKGAKFVLENDSIADPVGATRLQAELCDRIRDVLPSFVRPSESMMCHYSRAPGARLLLRNLDEQNGRVLGVSACSGHGFKFAPALADAIIRDAVSNSHWTISWH